MIGQSPGDPTLTSIYSDSYQLLLGLLIEARKNAQMTQSQLAELLSRPQSFVSKYERGERRLDVIEFLEICDQLSADPHKVIRSLSGAPCTPTSPH